MKDGFVEFRRYFASGSKYTVQVRASAVETVEAYGSRAILHLSGGRSLEVEHPVEDVLERLRGEGN